MPEQPVLTINANLDVGRLRQAIAASPEITADHLERASILSTLQVEATVKENIAAAYGAKPAAVCYGTLLNSVYGEPCLSPRYGGIVTVAPPADVYAAPVEFGSRPHFPPPEALYAWVKKRFGLEKETEIKSAAWAVARKISGRTTPGHHMFERAVASETEPVQRLFQQELDAAMAEIDRLMSGQ